MARCDVAVVGAGPAGTAAAVTAVGAGARVVLLDAEARPGGQYWRHGPGGGAGPGSVEHAARWRALARRLDSALTTGRLSYHARSRVWRLDPGQSGLGVLLQVVHEDGGNGVDASARETVEAAAVVLAPGAHDRVLPFPGWDVPGVLTAGAAQALLKEHGVRAGSRVVVAGTGPFLLPVAAGLAEADVRVLEIDEAGDGRGWARGWRAAAGAPARIADGVRYGALLARHRVPVHLRHAVVAAHGSDRLDGVTIARIDENWRIVRSTERHVECDVVAVSWGFTARLDLALQAGCDTEPGPDGAPAVRVDATGRTSVPRVLAAGELTGIVGAEQALLEGAVAGSAAAAVAAGREPAAVHHVVDGRRARLTAFAAAMHAAHPVQNGWTSWLADETVICRCEEVSAGDVSAAIDDLGATDARTVKLLTRAGMGWCQGRMCAEAVARLVATTRRVPFDPYADLLAGSGRPVAFPVPLAAVAAAGLAADDSSSGGSS